MEPVAWDAANTAGVFYHPGCYSLCGQGRQEFNPGSKVNRG